MMDFKYTNISWKRHVTDYSKVQRLISIAIRNRLFQINRPDLSIREYLDVRCGHNIDPGFINLDYWWHPGIDLCWDIRRGLPLKTERINGIFTEHCIEHIRFESVQFILSEFFRVLKPGGTVRVIVPNGELYLMRYTDLTRGVDDNNLPYAREDERDGLYSPIMSVNRIFYGHGHEFIYDFCMLSLILERAGFTDIRRERYGEGRDRKLLKDSESRAAESLYVEASKPSHSYSREEE